MKKTDDNKCTHEWDNLKGKYQPGRAWVGIKGRCIRTCKKCGQKEEFNKGPIFFGWYKYDE